MNRRQAWILAGIIAAAAHVRFATRDHQSYDPSDQGVSIGRYIKSSGNQDFVALASATPGAANAQPKIGPIVIDEIMYNPAAGANEFVELHNITNGSVDMSGWTFDTGPAIETGSVDVRMARPAPTRRGSPARETRIVSSHRFHRGSSESAGACEHSAPTK